MSYDALGSEGENVIGAHYLVFCHGITDLTVDEAKNLIAYARDSLQT